MGHQFYRTVKAKGKVECEECKSKIKKDSIIYRCDLCDLTYD